jgi:hypothetical protein
MQMTVLSPAEAGGIDTGGQSLEILVTENMARVRYSR